MNIRSVLPAAAALALLWGCGALARGVVPEALRQPDTEGYNDVFEERPTTSIVGEFRTSLSGFLYARAFEYMHGGVVMRAATASEQERNVRLASHGDNLADHHGTAETSVVPEGERDVRGIWGRVERDTQPFMDIRHHGHRDLKEALPLFRLMTWSDPHFVEGYSLGAYLIFSAADDHNVERVLTFLDEGIGNNPRSWRLRKERGHYSFANLKDLDAAKEHLGAAVTILEKLPAGKVDDFDAGQVWSEYVQVLRKRGEKGEEIAWARRGLERYGKCPGCRKTLANYGLPIPAKKEAAR